MIVGLPLSGISTLFYGVLLLGIALHKSWCWGRGCVLRILDAGSRGESLVPTPDRRT